MLRMIRSAFAPLLSLLVAMFGNGFFNTFISLRMSFDGYPNFLIGLVNSSYYAGIMVGSIFMERSLSKVGYIRTFATIASFNAIIILLQSLIIDPVSWTIFRFFGGICAAGFFIVIESWLLLKSTIKTRGKLLSLYMLTLYIGQSFGQLLLNSAGIENTFPFIISVLLCVFSIIPLCMLKSSAPHIVESSKTRIFFLFKNVPLGIIGAFIAGLILSSFYALGPIFAKELGFSLLQISTLMGSTILGGVLLQWPIGHFSDIVDRRKVMLLVCTCLLIISFAIFFFTTLGFLAVLILCVLFGGFCFTLYPLCITYTCDFFSSKHTLKILSSILIVYGVGCILGPLIAPIFMLEGGPTALFLFTTMLCALLILIALWKLAHGRKVQEEDQGDYISMPSTSAISYSLDPRTSTHSEEEEEEEEIDEHLFQTLDEEEEDR